MTASVWARDHFQRVAVGVGEIDPASPVVIIDLARAATPRVGPVLETLLTDAAEDPIEISLGNQESVVLWLDRAVMCSPRRLVEGSDRKGLAVVAQCARSASFAHSRLPAPRAGAVDPHPSLASVRYTASEWRINQLGGARC
jgi:hypothetical protein